MQSARRKKYLKALEIETWVSRDAPPESFAVAEPMPVVEKAQQKVIPVAPPMATSVVAAAPDVRKAKVVTNPATAIKVPEDWAGVRALVKDCRACRLCETRTQTVFGVGPESAPLMVVGEGPGADEDARGEPFVGRAGQLLDQMLRAIGRSRRTDTYIANVVKCRPPNNREPAEDEAEACRAYLETQLKLVKPKLILALGRVAAQRLLMTDAALSKIRGQMHSWGPDATPLMVTYHPAYLLRSPGEKAKSWQDLKKAHQFLQATGGA